MINFRLPIRGVDDSITRPVSIGVLNDIKEVLFINKDVRSKLANQIDDFITNEQWDPIKLEQNSPKLEQIKFSVNEDVNTETLITTSTNYNEYKPVLHDEEINAYIRPIYVESKIHFTIKFRSKSKTNVTSFVNMLKLSIAENEAITLHDIEYMFYLPPEVLEAFLDIARLKENVNKAGKNYEDYLIANTDGRMTIVGALDGNIKNMNIVCKEKQLEVVGFFSDSVTDVKGEYNSTESVWQADINYNLSYNKPIALNVSYPPLIFNQLLPKKYLIVKDTKLGKNDQHRNKTYIGQIHEPFNNGLRLEAAQEKVVNSADFVNIPNFDTYKPSRPQPWMLPAFSLLVSITPDDKTNLFNLGQLPEYELNEKFLKYIVQREWEYICKKYQSIFYIEILENDEIMKDNTLTMDSELNVSSTVELDLKKTYRVVFNLVTDLSVVSKKAVLRIMQYSDVYNTALTALNIKNPKLNRVLDKDEKVMIYNAKNIHKIPYTVMINTVLAYRQKRRRR